MKRKVIVFSVFILLSLLIAGGAGYLIYRFYFMPNSTVVEAFEEGKLNLVIEGEVVKTGQPKIVDEDILLPLNVIKQYFDPNIYWDDVLKKVTVTTRDRVIRMKTDSLNALVNNKPITLKIPVTQDNGVIYVPIQFLSDFYGIDISYIKGNNVIVIDYKNSLRQLAEPISPKAVIRTGKTIHFPIIKKFDLNSEKTEENTMRIFEEYDKWYKVRTSDGEIGYIEKQYVVVKRMMVKREPEEESKNSTWKPEKGKINLVWEMMYSKRPELAKIGKMDGLDVVSPTWFQIANEGGTLINRADATYVDWAHKNGYKVWALMSNDFGNTSMTTKFLNNTDARDNVIKQMLAFAALYKLDGINIDFENVNKEDKNVLTQFIREITPFFKEQGLVVSMDVTVPDGSDNWSLCYDRKALGQIVDYIMLMTYDQYWATSPKAGSVAQITWVESNLNKVLEMVPREKLLLGLPFYTRLWKEEPDKDGKIKVSNPKVLSMEDAKKLVKENNAPVTWDEKSGQFYAEYKKDNATYKVWLEDENSINLKSALAQKYKLAGTAAWRRSDEAQAVWGVLNKNLKVLENYQDWAAENKEKKYAFN